MPFIAGGYTVTYGGAALGQIADGITIEHFVNKQLITGDNYALTPQDAVYQGEECFMEFTLMEYNAAAARSAFWPYAASYGLHGIVGRLDVGSSLVAALVMTAVAGTPAASTPATVTASRAVLAEGFPVRILFQPALREVPLRMRLYLSDPAGAAPDGTEAFFALT